jgi:hypothetical protein
MFDPKKWNTRIPRETFGLWVTGKITDDQAGLHNIYQCERRNCTQCEAKQHSCWYWQGVIHEWIEDTYGWVDLLNG